MRVAFRNRIAFGLFLLILVGGSGVFAYQADDVYLRGRASVALATPGALIPGANGSLLVAVTDYAGLPFAGEPVTVHVVEGSATRFLASGVTDDRGIAALVFEVPNVAGSTRLRVTTRADSFDETLPVDPARTMHVSTDRIRYTPGDTIEGRVIILGGRPARVLEEDAYVSLIDARGISVHSARARSGADGVATFTIPLGEAVPAGDWVIRVESGAARVAQVIRVSRDPPPRMILDFADAPRFITPTSQVEVTLSARHVAGGSVAGVAAVTASVYDNGWRLLTVKQGELEHGHLRLTVPFGNVNVGASGSLLALRAMVSDAAGSENVTRYIPVSSDPLEIAVLAPAPVTGQNMTLRMVVSFPDGSPAVGALVNASLGGKRVPAVRTDDRGIATMRASFEGSRALVVTADLGNGTRGVREVTLESPTALAITAQDATVIAGDVARFTIHRQTAEEAALYYEVHASGVLEVSGRIVVTGRERVLEIPTSVRMAPAARVSIFEVGADLGAARAATVVGVTVPDALHLDLRASSTIVRPGDSFTVELNATRGSLGVPAVIGLSGSDAATEAALRESSAEFAHRAAKELDLDPVTAYLATGLSPGMAGFPPVTHAGSGSVARFETSEGSDAYRAQALVIKNKSVLAYWAAVIAVLATLVAFSLTRVVKHALGRPRTANVMFLAALLVFPSAAAWVVTDVPSGVVAPDDDGADALATRAPERQFSSDVPFALPALRPVQGLNAEKVEARSFDDSYGASAPAPMPPGNRSEGSTADANDGNVARAPVMAGSESNFVFYNADANAPLAFTVQPDQSLRTSGSRTRAELLEEARRTTPESFAWMPRVVTDASGLANVTVDAPKTPGDWRIHALAHTADADLATARIDLAVLSPVMLFTESVPVLPVGANASIEVTVFATGNGLKLLGYPATGVGVYPLETSWNASSPQIVQTRIHFTALSAGTHHVILEAVTERGRDTVVVPVRVEDGIPRSRNLLAPVSASGQFEALLPAGTDRITVHAGAAGLVADTSAKLHERPAASATESIARLGSALAHRAVLSREASVDTHRAVDARVVRDVQDVLAYATRAPDGSITVTSYAGSAPRADLTARALDLLNVARADGLPVPADTVQAMARGLQSLARADGAYPGGDAVTARAALALANTGFAPSRDAAVRALEAVRAPSPDPLAQALLASARAALGTGIGPVPLADPSQSTATLAATLDALLRIGAPAKDRMPALREILSRNTGLGFGGALETSDAARALARAIPRERTAIGIAVNGTEVLNGEVASGGTVTARFNTTGEGGVLAFGNTGPGLAIVQIQAAGPIATRSIAPFLVVEEDSIILRIRALGALHGPLRVSLATPSNIQLLTPPATPVLEHATMVGGALVLHLDAPAANQDVAIRIPMDGRPDVRAWFSVDVLDIGSGERATASASLGGRAS